MCCTTTIGNGNSAPRLPNTVAKARGPPVLAPRPTTSGSRVGGRRLLSSLRSDGTTARVTRAELHALDAEVPGDVSSAAFLVAAALLVPSGDVIQRCP